MGKAYEDSQKRIIEKEDDIDFSGKVTVREPKSKTDIVNKEYVDENKILNSMSHLGKLNGSLLTTNKIKTKSHANILYSGQTTSETFYRLANGNWSVKTGMESSDLNWSVGISTVGRPYVKHGMEMYEVLNELSNSVLAPDLDTTNFKLSKEGRCEIKLSMAHFKNRDNDANNTFTNSLIGFNKAFRPDSIEKAFGNDMVPNEDGIEIRQTTLSTNASGDNYVLHQTLYTHLVWGLTNHNRPFICAYNPITQEVLYVFEGSGKTDHRIPNPLKIKLNYLVIKNLDNATTGSILNTSLSDGLSLDTPSGDSVGNSLPDKTGNYIYFDVGAYPSTNGEGDIHCSFGFANSESKVVFKYKGNGQGLNPLPCKDVNGRERLARRVIFKSIDTVQDYLVYDSLRGKNYLRLNEHAEEVTTTSYIDFKLGRIDIESTTPKLNENGRSYLAIVEFDTDGDIDNRGDTYFDIITNNSTIEISNGELTFPKGKKENGLNDTYEKKVNGVVTVDEKINGIKYLALDEDLKPCYYDNFSIGNYKAESAKDIRPIFDTETNKWYGCTNEEILQNENFVIEDSWLISGNGSSQDWSGDGLLLTAGAGETVYLSQRIELEVGKTYKIKGSISEKTVSSTGFMLKAGIGETGKLDLYVEIVNDKVYSFVAQDEFMYVGLQFSNGRKCRVVNLSVYEEEVSTNNPLEKSICFLGTKPYRIIKGIPGQVIENRDPLPFNVLPNLYVDGLLTGKNVKIVDYDIVFKGETLLEDNPFGNENYESCFTLVEVSETGEEGTWFSVGGTGGDSSNNTYGIISGSTKDGILVQVAKDYIANSLPDRQCLATRKTTTLTQAHCRVKVFFIGKVER